MTPWKQNCCLSNIMTTLVALPFRCIAKNACKNVYLTIRSYSSFSSNSLQYVSNTFWHAYFKQVLCCADALCGGDTVGWTAASVQIGQYMCRCKSSISPFWKFNSICLPIHSVLIPFIFAWILFITLFLFFSFLAVLFDFFFPFCYSFCFRTRIVNCLTSLHIKINFRPFFRCRIFYESSIPVMLRDTHNLFICLHFYIHILSFYIYASTKREITSVCILSFATVQSHMLVELIQWATNE